MCRTHTGLPETVIPAVTPRGVKVGDPAARMIERYGHPSRVVDRGAGMRLAVYELPLPAEAHVDHVILSCMVDHGRVTGFMLQGDLPSVKRPN